MCQRWDFLHAPGRIISLPALKNVKCYPTHCSSCYWTRYIEPWVCSWWLHANFKSNKQDEHSVLGAEADAIDQGLVYPYPLKCIQCISAPKLLQWQNSIKIKGRRE
jgi:hypothetical protein